MIDPRLAVIQKRLAPIKRILVFSSTKGGVGKSLCAASSALVLSRRGFKIGLLDLDFQGAAAHVLLGQELGFPEEEAGIKPFAVNGRLHFMSFAPFSREHPVPLRGGEVTQATLELLAITVWPELDFLLVDMPPGIGDEILDLLRFMPQAEFIVIATPSPVVIRVVERLLKMLKGLEAPLLGLIENMANHEVGNSAVGELAGRYQTVVLGSIPYLGEVDRLIGNPEALANSALGTAIENIFNPLV